MIYKPPQTLVRVGRFDNSLEEVVKNFHEKLEPIPFGLRNTVKYATFKEAEEPYLLIVSQQKDRLTTSIGYNTILTATSYSDRKNKEVAEQFEQETGISLDIKVPEQLRRHFRLMNMSFQVFEKNPKAAMNILRGVL